MKAFPRVFLALVLALTPSFAETSDTLHLTLGKAMEIARKSAYPARLAISRSRESAARTAEARSALLPHLGATASDVIRSYNTSTFGISLPGAPALVKPFNAQDARITGRLTLWDAAALQRYRAAQRGEDRTQWDQRAGEEEAALAGADAYLALLRARSLVKARNYEVALAARLDTLTQAQKKAGSVTKLEVLPARGQLSTAQMALASATGDEAAARYVLLQVLDQPIDAEIVTTDTLSTYGQGRPTLGAHLDSAARSRPEVAAAAADVEAAHAELAAARAGYLPTLEAAGDYGLNGRRLYTGGAQWTEDIALQLNWSLWDGGGHSARIRQKQERLHQSQLRLSNLRSQAARDARLEQSLLAAAQEEVSRAGERVAISEEEAQLAAEKFRAGSSGNLEVISAQGSVSAAHSAYVDALYRYNHTRLAYLRALNLLGTATP